MGSLRGNTSGGIVNNQVSSIPYLYQPTVPGTTIGQHMSPQTQVKSLAAANQYGSPLAIDFHSYPARTSYDEADVNEDHIAQDGNHGFIDRVHTVSSNYRSLVGEMFQSDTEHKQYEIPDMTHDYIMKPVGGAVATGLGGIVSTASAGISALGAGMFMPMGYHFGAGLNFVVKQFSSSDHDDSCNGCAPSYEAGKLSAPTSNQFGAAHVVPSSSILPQYTPVVSRTSLLPHARVSAMKEIGAPIGFNAPTVNAVSAAPVTLNAATIPQTKALLPLDTGKTTSIVSRRPLEFPRKVPLGQNSLLAPRRLN